MKLLLSITITIKDFIPKDKRIPYHNFICLFSHNNFTDKIHLSNIQNQNFIRHKVEVCDSNLVYNIHMLDTIKSTLIGIYQIIINFDKIKNLNINDTLTQEETAKLIIDSKTKRKLFDRIKSMEDIYLNLSTEIKVIDKKNYSSGSKINTTLIKKCEFPENNEQISEFILTPETFKKKQKQIIRSLKSIKDTSKRIDTFSGYNENNITDYIKDENDTTFMQGSTIKKYKSLNKASKITHTNKFKEISLNNNNPIFNNSCTVIMSPKNFQTKYNLKNESKTKTNKKKKPVPMKKITILNLMEQKMDSSIYKQKDENIFEINPQIKNFKSTSINFNKNLKNYYKKNSFCSLNRRTQNSIKKINSNLKNIEDSDYFRKKNCQNNNKIIVNLLVKNKHDKTVSERKYTLKNNKIKLDLFDISRINTENNKIMNKSHYQVENSIKKLSARKRDIKRNILTDFDIKKLIKEKSDIVQEKFNNIESNNYFPEKGRGTFSPKLSLKIKFNEGMSLYNEKTDIITIRYKGKIREEDLKQKVLTPKGNQVKRRTSLSNEDNSKSENEELRKKCFNLINFYSLLTKKLKKACLNNRDHVKQLEIIKEKHNNLKKCNYKIGQMKNNNDSKKIKNHVFSHFKEEQLLNKMLDIKLKENSIFLNIFENIDNDEHFQEKIDILFAKKKEILLDLIRNIVKFYGNISQIYDADQNKKEIFLNLLEKYDIKEKIKTADLNYINFIHKENNLKDKIITEVDEDKENEEEDNNEKVIKFNNNSIKNQTAINNINNNNNSINNFKDLNIENKENNCNINNIFEQDIKKTNTNKNRIQEIIINVKKYNRKNSSENIYDENLNNLIDKILIEQFPNNYKTNMKFIHQNKNIYAFNDKLFHAFIENNDVILKEDINNNIDNNKYTLNEFYKKFCNNIEKSGEKPNFIYTKKIKQKYIKLKNNDNEQVFDKNSKNENSTTIETENKQNSMYQ